MAILTKTSTSLILLPSLIFRKTLVESLKHHFYFSNFSLKFIFTNLMAMIFDKLEMNSDIEIRKDG